MGDTPQNSITRTEDICSVVWKTKPEKHIISLAHLLSVFSPQQCLSVCTNSTTKASAVQTMSPILQLHRSGGLSFLDKSGSPRPSTCTPQPGSVARGTEDPPRLH